MSDHPNVKFHIKIVKQLSGGMSLIMCFAANIMIKQHIMSNNRCSPTAVNNYSIHTVHSKHTPHLISNPMCSPDTAVQHAIDQVSPAVNNTAYIV